ncbi:DUF2637 domain-containing protein [Nonomuraea sp. NBC_00507]|uniref:hypothetical protein n=1 Tax=Nonomuraea sp. NBC_00507 TaxID=2976002 RepID=UPI002E17EF10
MHDPTSAAAAAPTRRAHQADPIERVGVAVVAVAAAVLSFSALAGLGGYAGFGTVAVFAWDAPLSPLIPLCIDVYGATAVRIASRRCYSDETRRQALIHAMAAIVVGVIGNGTYHLLETHVLVLGDLRWLLVIAVSVVPPVALGAMLHLMALTARDRQDADQVHEAAAVPATEPTEVRDAPAQVREPGDVPTAAGAPPAPTSAAAPPPLLELGPAHEEHQWYPARHAQTLPAPEPEPAPEPGQVRLPQLDPALRPVVLQAVETFAPDGELDRVPTIREVKEALNVGQPKATRVRAYLSELVAS